MQTMRQAGCGTGALHVGQELALRLTGHLRAESRRRSAHVVFPASRRWRILSRGG